MNDYLASQVILLCDMTERYANQRGDNVWVADSARLRPAVRQRFAKARRRLKMAAPLERAA